LFLNNLADIIVAHGSGQISVIHASDYQPFEIPAPAKEIIEGNINLNNSFRVNSCIERKYR
jgi:hypothetical protein